MSDPRRAGEDMPVAPPTERLERALDPRSASPEDIDPRLLATVGMTPERWQDRWEFYVNQPQQVSAVWLLYNEIRALPGAEAVLSENAPWALKYSEKPPAPPPQAYTNPLTVPYFSQNDNASGTGWRECFSSSCAMVAAYYDKIGSDDEYNKIRAKYGDTTDASAQVAALESLGLRATFIQNGSVQWLENEILEGRPVPCGWLHQGSVNNPSGGGHWTVVVGSNNTHWIHNDPNGVADMVNGGYTPEYNGKNVKYTRKNWDRRWCVYGPNDGWALQIEP